jgi:prepilin-type N-terminal cleavage/methylation domain-containing protein
MVSRSTIRTAPSRMKLHRTQAAFTLIEVMVTVAIVAILASVAVPFYGDYVLRGDLTQATNGLSAMRADTERFYQDNRTYATTGAIKTPCEIGAAYGKFTLSCVGTPAAKTFKLQAVGSGATAGFTYTIDQNEVMTTTVSGHSGYISCGSKWILKRGDTCP